MQLVKILFFILLIGNISCSNKEVNKEVFWQSVFNYLDDRHFILEIPPSLSSNSSQQEQRFRRLCSSAVIHINNEKIEYPKAQLEEIEEFLNHSVNEQMINISKEDFLLVDIPISFQDFNKLSREEKFFTKRQQCGLFINAPIIYKNRAVLFMGIMYNPKSVADYLLFWEYCLSKKKWKIIKQEILGFS